MNKTLKLPGLVAAIAALCFVSLSGKPVQIGFPAPDFSLSDIDGNPVRLSDFKGRIVVLEWTNPECPIVRKHYDKSGNIPGLQRKATADGIVWLSINSGPKGGQGDLEPGEVRGWLKKNQAAPTAYLRDVNREVGKLYDARVTPHMYVIDSQGILVYNGAIDSISSGNVNDIAKAENYVASALDAVKEGRPPTKATSRPYGCSIKY